MPTDTDPPADPALLDAIARQLGLPPGAVQADQRLADLVPSSFSLVELLIELQEQHGIRLAQDDLRSLVTVGDLVALVRSKQR
jgi:acyl carrier protein